MEEKLTQLEKCWLVALYSDGYRYIARDLNNDLYAYDKKPEWNNEEDYWDIDDEYRTDGIPERLFKYIPKGNKGLFEISCKAIYIDHIDLVRYEE